jgi:hypothetical protein
MARYGVVVLSIFMMAAMALLAGACGTQGSGGTPQVGKMQHDSESVDPKDAQSASAQLKMGAGELNLTGGADQLMEADFSYNVSEWKPKVSYDVSGKKGELVVKQGSAEGGNLSGGARNEWDISMNDELPIDLVVQLGAGESNLDLDSLTLKGLDLQVGAGKITVDLTGDYTQGFDASIEGGAGYGTAAERGWGQGESRRWPGWDQRQRAQEGGRRIRQRRLRRIGHQPKRRRQGRRRGNQPEGRLGIFEPTSEVPLVDV